MSIRPIDLRDILEYVPRFRNHVFVLSIDGSVIADSNFESVLTDIAVLQSLNIKVVICHGIAHQIRELSSKENIEYTNDRGDGPTDDATLQLALKANYQAQSRLINGLSKQGLPYSISNSIDARPLGIVKGAHQKHTGICDKINHGRIESLLSRGETPIFSPLIHDEKGRTLRVNSDQMAASVATKLKASKLIYLTSRPRLTVEGNTILNCSAEELKNHTENSPESIDPLLLSKAKYAIEVLSWNTDRVHILDGRIDGCLLIEIFDKVGLGTMIHANEYDRIRQAQPDDAPAIYALVKQGSKTNQLVHRSLEAVAENVTNYFVYEVDDSIIGCTQLISYSEQTAEMASVCVQPYHQGKGIGRKLAEYTLEAAQKNSFEQVFALSTQASEFFVEQLGFAECTADELPEVRRLDYSQNKRNSIVLRKIF